MTRDLFSRLNKYGLESPENYLTEALVVLLQEILSRDPQYGLLLTNRLAHLAGGVGFTDSRKVTYSTQVSNEDGRPDIQITDGESRLVFVEVKHDAPLHCGQLEAYDRDLSRSGFAVTRLVLLTRSRHSRLETTLKQDQYGHTCWYEIYNWLGAGNSEDLVCEYLASHFRSFLEIKGMNLNRVSWEYMRGIPALVDLVTMMEAAIEEAIPDEKAKRTGGWFWRGFYLNDLFIGVRYDAPMMVVFENARGYYAPTFKRDFDLDRGHFFAMTQEEQFEKLCEFIQGCFAEYRASGLISLVSEGEVSPEEGGAE